MKIQPFMSILLMILSIATSPVEVTPKAIETLSALIWNRIVGDSNYSYQNKTIAISAKDKVE